MFFSSDHHFHHRNILAYENRPFRSMDEMHDAMIDEWNAHVKEGHSVFYLGDFCLGKWRSDYDYALSQMNGDVWNWMRGNHDVSVAKLNTLARVFATKAMIIPIHDIGGVLLTHKPQYDYDTDAIALNIHGHIHTRGGRDVIYEKDGRIFFHVGVDANNFKPWHVDNVARIYKRFRRKVA